MSKKKKSNSKKSASKPVAKKNDSKRVWIIATVAIVAVVALIAVLANGSGQQQVADGSGDEQAYVGRFLPAEYKAPSVAERTLYTETIGMSVVTGTQSENEISVPLDTVVADKIVRFDYQRADGEVLPMIAYVKPSGDLFVGVSYCPPCEGEGQRIEADGTLTCESCGTKRNLETNAGISGACRLYPLDEVPSTVEGNDILVGTSVLDSWTAQPLDRPVG